MIIGRRRTCGFTLAEVLAALVFMAIVIPVALEALRIANRAGVVAERKAVAARVAERVLNESLITSQIQGLSQTGVIDEGPQQYRWTIRTEPWTEDAMLLMTVEVLFTVQGDEFDVRLSTLVNNNL
jgi:type II secretory pathway pseudopilin PulG